MLNFRANGYAENKTLSIGLNASQKIPEIVIEETERPSTLDSVELDNAMHGLIY
jgi:hypothetical protein